MEFENLLTLIKTVSDSELTDFDYEENGTRIRLKKKKETVVVSGFSAPISFSVLLVGTLHQKRYFAFLCYRGHFLLHKPGVKMMSRGLFHFSGNLIEYY